MAMSMAESQNQNSEVTSASMHDIPLSNDIESSEEQQTTPGSIEKIPSKSSSLKRFFKLGLNKKVSTSNDGGTANETNIERSAAGNDADTEDGSNGSNDDSSIVPKIDVAEIENQGAQKAEVKRSRSRRFNFRFHGKDGKAENATNETPSSSASPSNLSRHSLRGSLSTYFNSVFKRKQNAQSKHTLRLSKKTDSLKAAEAALAEQQQKQQAAEQQKDGKEQAQLDLESNQMGLQHIVTEDNGLEIQTAEIISEIETVTITEHKSPIESQEM